MVMLKICGLKLVSSSVGMLYVCVSLLSSDELLRKHASISLSSHSTSCFGCYRLCLKVRATFLHVYQNRSPVKMITSLQTKQQNRSKSKPSLSAIDCAEGLAVSRYKMTFDTSLPESDFRFGGLDKTPTCSGVM